VKIDELLQSEPFGSLRGRYQRDRHYDFVAAGRVKLPGRGDFALVPDRGRDRVLVFRVTSAELTGAFGESSDRGQEFLSQVARYGGRASVPDRVRELAVRHRIHAIVLGWLELENDATVFRPGMRELELFGQPAYLPSESALALLANVGLQDGKGDDVVRLGAYVRGHDVSDTEVRFSINRLKGRRTFVFARAGYGKSNLTKLLLSRLYKSEPDVGLLIVDPDGEYAFTQTSETGASIPGFLDIPELSDRAIVFTQRADLLRKGRPNVYKVGVDLRQITADEFITLFVGVEKVDQVWVNRLRALRKRHEQWQRLVNLLHERSFSVTDEEIAEVLGVRVQVADDGKKKGADVSISAIRNNVIPVIERLHDPDNDMLPRAKAWLRGRADLPPGVVIFDTSVLSAVDAESIARILLGQVFHESVQAFTSDGRKSGVLLVLEEAQTVLGGHRLNDRDIYVRWAKEGRKYGLGAMLITQQPGALANELISQGDNFFAMHLLTERDLRALGEANDHFGDDVLDFLRSEPIKGNCYFWSAPHQPYVVPVRLDSYEATTHVQPARVRPAPVAAAPRADAGLQPAAAPAPVAPELPLAYLADTITRAVAASPRVFRYEVASVRGVPAAGKLVVATKFLAALASNRIDPALLRQGDLERRNGYDYLRTDHVLAALRQSGVLAEPATGRAKLEIQEHDVILLDLANLRAWCKQHAAELGAIRAAVAVT
jgi:hypothetical protein